MSSVRMSIYGCSGREGDKPDWPHTLTFTGFDILAVNRNSQLASMCHLLETAVIGAAQ